MTIATHTYNTPPIYVGLQAIVSYAVLRPP